MVLQKKQVNSTVYQYYIRKTCRNIHGATKIPEFKHMSAIYVVNLNEFFANGKVNAYNNEKYDVNEKKIYFFIFFICGKNCKIQGFRGGKNTTVRWGGEFTVVEIP